MSNREDLIEELEESFESCDGFELKQIVDIVYTKKLEIIDNKGGFEKMNEYDLERICIILNINYKDFQEDLSEDDEE